MTFTEALRREAEKTAAELDELYQKHHALEVEQRKTILEISLLNSLLRFNGESPISLESIDEANQ